MRGLLRPIVLIALILAIPIVPFLFFGQTLENAINDWLHESLSSGRMFVGVVGLLAVDIFLPIPSSAVSTVAAGAIGFTAATLASWIGMTLDSILGFAIARAFGPPMARRFSDSDDLGRMEMLSRRHGPTVLVLTRPLPVLAEACVLWFGAVRLPWRVFLPPIVLSNLGIAAAYSALGSWVYMPVAVAASIALPLLATVLARRCLRDVA